MKRKELLATLELKTPVWTDFQYDLTKELGSEIMVVFRVSRTWEPQKELGTADRRELGIAVGQVHFLDLPVRENRRF